MGGGPRAGPVPQPVSVVSRDWVREGSPRRQGESVRRPLRGLEGADVVAGGRGADPAPGECEVVRVEKETVADSEGARRGTGPTLFPSSVLFPRVPVMTPDYRSLGLGSPPAESAFQFPRLSWWSASGVGFWHRQGSCLSSSSPPTIGKTRVGSGDPEAQ